MNIVHLQLSGGIGGISVLTNDISKLSKHNNIFYFLFEGGCIADDMATHSTVHVANGSHSNFIGEAVKFTKFCKKHHADVIISHTGSPIVRFICAFAKKALGKKVKMLLYCHSNACITLYSESAVKKFLDRALLNLAYKSSDKVVAISKSVKQSFVNVYGFNPDKVVVVYNGINCDKFYSNRLNGSNNTFNIIYVGRVLKIKGIHILIDAISRLPENVKVSVKIVGTDNGGFTEKMIEKSQKLGLSEKIEFTGARLDVPELLADADLFIHPAVCEEGFGITLAEAMAAYLPCIAFNKGAIPEIIDNEINGFIVEKTTPEELAKAIENAYIIFKTDKYNQLRNNAYKKAECFNIENTVAQLEALYN